LDTGLTSVRLYQRRNTEGFPLIPVPYSRNGSPIAHKNATAFYLRYRAGGKRHCIPAGANVLEADAVSGIISGTWDLCNYGIPKTR